MEIEVARSCELMMITGNGTGNVYFAKKATVHPGQSYTTFNVSPRIYIFQVEAMSAENLPLFFYAIVTIGPPHVADYGHQGLLKYVQLISCPGQLDAHVCSIVQAESQALIADASITNVEDIKTLEFKQHMLVKVQSQLNQSGLLIHNFAIVDVPSPDCFSYLFNNTTDQMEQKLLFSKSLSPSDLKKLAVPMEAYRQYLKESFVGNELLLNVMDDFGFFWELRCRRRREGDINPRPEIASMNWDRFVYQWNLEAGDYVILYQQLHRFTGIRYRIGVVRMARIGAGSRTEILHTSAVQTNYTTPIPRWRDRHV